MIFQRYPRRPAFTLIELLVVMAIIGLAATMVIANFPGLQRSMAMNSSAAQLLDYLATARQNAMTLNQPVKIWFCPGTTNDSLLLYSSTNAIAPELKLKEPVTLSTSGTWSSVFTVAGTKQNDPKRGNSCYSFRFMPDGSTDLGGTASPTLTLIYRTDSSRATLPPNFFTLQIDQQNGTVRTFRPQ